MDNSSILKNYLDRTNRIKGLIDALDNNVELKIELKKELIALESQINDNEVKKEKVLLNFIDSLTGFSLESNEVPDLIEKSFDIDTHRLAIACQVLIENVLHYNNSNYNISKVSQSFPGMTFVFNEAMQIEDVNQHLKEKLGYLEEDQIVGADVNAIIQTSLKNFSNDGIIEIQELKSYALKKNEDKIPIELYVSTFDNNNNKKNYIAFLIDKSAELGVELNLLNSDTTFKKLIESMQDGVVITDNYDTVLYANTGFEKMFGYSLEQAINKKTYDILHRNNDKGEELASELIENRKKGLINVYERSFVNFNERLIWAEITGVPLRNQEGEVIGSIGIFRDISERKMTENELQTSVKEKEVLLKEMHHRVKNNLQIITSLLSLQAHHTNDESLELMLKDSQNRIRSMSIIHEKLYRSDSLSDIAFNAYVSEIVEYLKYSYESIGVEVNYNIDDVSFDLEKAVPCGLIINELVANAMKYAFPEENGKIFIELKKVENGIKLIIADNGIGLPDNIDFNSDLESLGMQLVDSLIDQIDGTIEVDNSKGAKFIMFIPN